MSLVNSSNPTSDPLAKFFKVARTLSSSCFYKEQSVSAMTKMEDIKRLKCLTRLSKNMKRHTLHGQISHSASSSS